MACHSFVRIMQDTADSWFVTGAVTFALEPSRHGSACPSACATKRVSCKCTHC